MNEVTSKEDLLWRTISYSTAAAGCQRVKRNKQQSCKRGRAGSVSSAAPSSMAAIPPPVRPKRSRAMAPSVMARSWAWPVATRSSRLTRSTRQSPRLKGAQCCRANTVDELGFIPSWCWNASLVVPGRDDDLALCPCLYGCVSDSLFISILLTLRPSLPQLLPCGQVLLHSGTWVDLL